MKLVIRSDPVQWSDQIRSDDPVRWFDPGFVDAAYSTQSSGEKRDKIELTLLFSLLVWKKKQTERFQFFARRLGKKRKNQNDLVPRSSFRSCDCHSWPIKKCDQYIKDLQVSSWPIKMHNKNASNLFCEYESFDELLAYKKQWKNHY